VGPRVGLDTEARGIIRESETNNNTDAISDYRNKWWEHFQRREDDQTPYQVLNCCNKDVMTEDHYKGALTVEYYNWDGTNHLT
jgi:hypothetical protein